MAEALGRDTTQVSAQSPFEGNLQAGGHGSDEENMNNVRHLLVERMDPDFGLIDKLLQLGALNYPETGRIKSERSIFDRNDKLLEIVFNKTMHHALLTALRDTGQKHLFNFVRGNGGYRPEYGTVWPLRDRETQILDENRFNLVDIIDPCDLITRVYSKGIINNRQQKYINGLHNDAEKAEALLDVLRRGSEECYWTTVLCLQESNQSKVAEILEDGGVLTQVHVSNEGEAEQVNEEEDHILEALANLLQNTTLPQYQRIRERLDLRIMRATKGHSIVFYIYCKTLEELLYLYELLTKGGFKKCISTVFDLLISKRETTVLAVNWSEEEFTKFKTYFEGKLQHKQKAVKQQDQSSDQSVFPVGLGIPSLDYSWSVTSSSTSVTHPLGNMEHLANVYVEIAEQPMGKGLRFRYISEGRTAGSIQGEFSTPERRTFPSIKVYNYTGQAYAVVSCVTTDKPPRPHPHHLVGTNCVKGVCKVAINVANDPIPFSNIGIQCCTRKDINKNLDERRVMNIDPFNTGYQANVDTIDLTTICLCFQVHINVNGQFFCLQPVVSNPIVDKKVCSELSIYRLSRISGSVRGGDEVFLLCTKVKKEDIKVMFSHTLENGEPWEKEGSFSSTDVHKQYVIVFKTPPYHDTDIKKAVEVSLYLLRPSDNAFGEAKTFTYYPENPDPFGIKAKRKRLAQSNPPCFIPEIKPSFSGSLASVIGAQPVSIPRFGVPSGVNDGLGQWSFPHLASMANTQGMPVIKPELPFYQTSQPGFDAMGPRSTRPASNPFAMSAIPITVEDASRGVNRPIPSSSVYSSSVTKEFNFGHVPLPFRSSSSASALEKLVTGNERMKLENFMNPAESQVKDPFSSGQTSTALMPTHSSQSATSSRLGMESLFSGLEDATLLTEFFGDDWLRANLPSEEQRFLTEAMPDLTDLTDDDDLKNFIGDLDFTM